MYRIVRRYFFFIFFLYQFMGICQAQEISDTDGYESLASALTHPSSATSIFLNGTASEITLLTSRASAFTHLNRLKIREASSTTGWNNLFTALSAYSPLHVLELSFNDVKAVPKEIALLKGLHSLIIWGAPQLDLNRLCKDLSGLDSLYKLELNSNEIKKTPPLELLQHLRSFTITDNENINYSSLIEKLAYLPDLRELSLELNSITDLPPSVSHLKRLEKLDISGNYISSLPEGMKSMTKLDSLSAESNLFVNYTDEFNKLKGLNIHYLSLDGQLTAEEKDALQKIFPKATIDEQSGTSGDPEKAPADTAASETKLNITFDAARGGVFGDSAGLNVRIPADAFSDSVGAPISGPVQLQVKTYRNQVDALLDGMRPDTSAAESIQSFSISAASNGKSLNLQPGASLIVSIPAEDSAQTVTVTKSGSADTARATMTGTIRVRAPSNRITSAGIKIYSNAWQIYRDYMEEYDTTLFAQRFPDSSYSYTRKYIYYFNSERNYDHYISLRLYRRSLKQIFIHKKNQPLHFYLQLTSGKNPETGAFGNKWICDSPVTRRQFRRQFIRHHIYSDIRIEQGVLKLKSSKGIVSIPASPDLRLTGTEAQQKKNIERRYSSYARSLARRESKFNRTLPRGRKKYSHEVWYNLRPQMTPEEKRLTYTQWINYFDVVYRFYKDTLAEARRSYRYLAYHSQKYIRRYRLEEMGYFSAKNIYGAGNIRPTPMVLLDAYIRGAMLMNIDRRLYAMVNIRYTDKNGIPVTPVYILVTDKRYNCISTVSSPGKFMLAIHPDKNLFAVMADGSVGIFTEKDFRKIKLEEGKTFTLDLTIYPKPALSELRKKLAY